MYTIKYGLLEILCIFYEHASGCLRLLTPHKCFFALIWVIPLRALLVQYYHIEERLWSGKVFVTKISAILERLILDSARKK